MPASIIRESHPCDERIEFRRVGQRFEVKLSPYDSRVPRPWPRGIDQPNTIKVIALVYTDKADFIGFSIHNDLTIGTITTRR